MCVDGLDQLLTQESEEALIIGLPFIRALRAMNQVTHRCFGQDLLDGWEESIGEFSTAYRYLEISVTPKVLSIWIYDYVYTHVCLLGPYCGETCQGVP